MARWANHHDRRDGRAKSSVMGSLDKGAEESGAGMIDSKIGEYWTAIHDEDDSISHTGFVAACCEIIHQVIEERAHLNSNGPHGMHRFHSDSCDCIERTLTQFGIPFKQWKEHEKVNP